LNNGRTFMTVARDVRTGRLPPRLDAFSLDGHGLEANVMRAVGGTYALERVRSAAGAGVVAVQLSQLPPDATVEVIHNGRTINAAGRPSADGTFTFSTRIPFDTTAHTQGRGTFGLHGNRYAYDADGGFVAIVVRQGARVILASSAIAYAR
jgi:hypothetical protein